MDTYFYYSGIILNIILTLFILSFFKENFFNLVKKYNEFCASTNFGSISGEDVYSLYTNNEATQTKEYKEAQEIYSRIYKPIHDWIPFIVARKDRQKLQDIIETLIKTSPKRSQA